MMNAAEPSCALPDPLARRADLSPDRLALDCLRTGDTLTYAALNDQAGRTAAWLRARHQGGAVRVAFLGRNSLEAWVVIFAALKAQATLALFNWRAPLTELAGLSQDFEPHLILHDGVERDAGAALSERIGAPAVNVDDPAWRRSRDGSSPIPPGFVSADHPWCLLYTSGTTGVPKGVIQTPRMALINAINIGGAIDLREDDRTLSYLPLFHSAGLQLHAMPTLLRGGLVRVAEGFDVDQVISLLADGRIDTFLGVPAVYRDIAAHPRFSATDLSRVRHWASGGAALSDDLARTFLARGVPICAGMGMTETGPTVFLADRATAARKLGTVGKPQLCVDVRIVGRDGSAAAIGEPGDLQVKGPGLTPGYWNKPRETAALFTKDGWLMTGDVARRDADGDYFIVGRSKDMFISGGENVYPAEVENALCDHPDVTEAAVVGVSDAKWGEVGHAFIRSDRGAIETETLRAHCEERLARYKVPRTFTFVDDFPRTAAGKIQKHKLLAGT